MKSIRTITALAILAFMVLATSSAFAATLTVSNVSGAAGETTVYVPITVDNPVGIAGAAFTINYDTNALSVTVDSTFFDTFTNQWNALDPVPDPLPPTSVEVDGISYDQPLITNEITGTGMRIAAARCKPADGSNTTLFTLTFTLNQGAQPINYPITVVQTVLDNTDAGYDAGGETIPMLVGADASKDVTDPDAFPILLDPAAAPPIGTTESGSVNFDTDGDGIVDNWEIAYFGNLTTADATSDYDKDGYSDLQEFFNNTRPNLQDPPDGPGYNPATRVEVPRVISVELGTAVDDGHYVAVFDRYQSGNGVWINPGENTGNSTTDPAFPAGPGGANLIAAPANMFGVSTGYGHLLLSVAADESIGIELGAIGDNTPTNANPDIFGGTNGPVNKNNIELDRAILEGTEVTFTVDMNNHVPHLVAVMGGTAPAVTYDDSGTGTLTIQTTTFGTITNAGDTFSSIVGFMIFTDESLGTDALRIIAQTNHWVGDIFPLLPGWDTNAVVGGGTQGTVTARCGTTIVGPTGDQRDIKIFFPDDSIASIFGNDVFNDELAAFVDSDEQPGATITLDVANFDTTGTLAEFTYTFGSKRDTSIGVSEGPTPTEIYFEGPSWILVDGQGTFTLNTEVPNGETLKAYNIQVEYDDSLLQLVSTNNLSTFPPINVNTTTAGLVEFNSFDTTGVPGPAQFGLLEFTFSGKGVEGTTQLTITVNSYGETAENQFPPQPQAFPLDIVALARGDADGSGSVDIFDALIVAEYDAGLKAPGELVGFAVADVDCTGSVDIFDALKIAEFDASLIPNLDCY